MTEDVIAEGPTTEDEFQSGKGSSRHIGAILRKWTLIALAAVVALIVAIVGFLHTPPGRQFIVDRIAKIAPASGLSVEVGSIEGSVLGSATFQDVRFRDANGVLFLEIPEVELDWRPLKFPFGVLDIRSLVAHDGTLHSSPELIPGDPDAPILPDFDIRVDRLLVDHLRVEKGMLGGEERVVNFRARAHVREGLALLDMKGELGGGDRFVGLVHAEPDGNVFDIDLDYRAPQGGFLAALAGAEEDLRVRIVGDGTWEKWDGAFVVTQDAERLAALKLYNSAGTYKVVGQVRPGEYLTGMPARALGETVSLAAIGTLEDSILEGDLAVRAAAIELDGNGAIDLADNAFGDLALEARLIEPAFFGEGATIRDAVLTATLDGPFRELDVPHELSIGELDLGGTRIVGLTQTGTLTFDGTRYSLPLDANVQRVTSGNAMIDPRLVNGTLRGNIVLSGDRLLSDDLALRFPGLAADLDLDGNLAAGDYALAGPVNARGIALQNIGTLDAAARIRFRLPGNGAWTLQADFNGRLPRVTNDTLTGIAGTNIRFRGGVALGGNSPLVFSNTVLEASKVSLTLDGRVEQGETTLAGSGRHIDYGPFTVEASLTDDGPNAALVFANPLPAAGLRDVRVAIAPTEEGFAIETQGQSTLGPFEGVLGLYSPPEGPTRINVERFDVWKTSVTGDLTLAEAGVNGTLALAGGGLDGSISLSPRGGGQGFDVDLTARNANFAGETPIAVRFADVDATGTIAEGNTTINGTMEAQGVSYGNIFLGQLQARARVANGVGQFAAQMSGRRGSQFALQVQGQVAPERIVGVARGSYGGRSISMPRRAVLTKTPDGGWQLRKTQLSFGSGAMIAEGRFGGETGTQGTLMFSKMPLSLADVVTDLGLGGTVSGVVDFAAGPGGLPTGEARVQVDDLTRSGLVLTSRPIDLALVTRLSPELVQARAVLADDGGTKGRLQGRISNLPQDGALIERLQAGELFAQLRYSGPADALWRLSALDLLDITGRLDLAADLRGTLRNPQLRGSLGGDDLRVQSSLTGTDVRNVRARGRFSGSRLQLTSFRGTAPNGGAVSGSGTVDLSGLGSGRGPQIDLRLSASDAEIMNLPTMGATVTGPLRIVSNGVGGTIAGRLRVNEARWKLGAATAAQELPNISVREVNLPTDIAPVRAPGAPWRFLIDAEAKGGVVVNGMGLDSEWSANVVLRGTTDDPRVGGSARIVPRQGFYTFAGSRFDITRGAIEFDENVPIDPRIDILAETEANDISVQVAVTGNAMEPEITFSSIPSLPEEEILARLLFGGSISDLSATDALQLGAALASLRGGGGGLDPINQLRSAIGLDRLRIVAADPARDRGTSVALGKRFGNRLYAEIITDGRGYNATEVEFRVTSWLSLLATVSSTGRQSLAGEYSKDY